MSEAGDSQRVPLEGGCFVVVCHAGIVADNSLHKEQWLGGDCLIPGLFSHLGNSCTTDQAKGEICDSLDLNAFVVAAQMGGSCVNTV